MTKQKPAEQEVSDHKSNDPTMVKDSFTIGPDVKALHLSPCLCLSILSLTHYQLFPLC